eukprot:g23866.t1
MTPNQRLPLVLMYQAAGTEPDQSFPNLRGYVSWAANVTDKGPNYQFDHLLNLEPLELPAEAADPKRAYGGHMHILVPRSVDYEFPPASSSLMGDSPHKSAERLAEITWRAVSTSVGAPLLEANTEPNVSHFVGLKGISPGDVTITRSVLAALREYPGYLDALLVRSPSVREDGKYTLQLFDMWQRRWRYLVVDDFMPVRTLSKGTERHWTGGSLHPLWVLLLEKALAKLCGSYEALRRSHPGALLMALTGQGDKLLHWRKDNGWWSACFRPKMLQLAWEKVIHLDSTDACIKYAAQL